MHIIECIQPDCFCKNLLIIRPDCGNRICNNRKAALLAFDIAVCNLPGLVCIINNQLLLFFIIMRGFCFACRRKRRFSKYLLHCRAAKYSCQLFVRLISIPQHFQPALHKCLIQIIRIVIAVVKIKLAVCGHRIAAALPVPPASHRRNRIPVYYRRQAHFFKIFKCPAHHAFKSNRIMNTDRLLFGNILARYLKPNPVAFGKRISHCLNLLLRQRPQKFRRADFVFRNIFTVAV